MYSPASQYPDNYTIPASIPFSENWELYKKPPEYVDYKEAFDAAVQGKNIRFDNHGYFTLEGDNQIQLQICSSTRLVVSLEMLTQKKWEIEK